MQKHREKRPKNLPRTKIHNMPHQQEICLYSAFFLSSEMKHRPKETCPVGEERDACYCIHASPAAVQGHKWLCIFTVVSEATLLSTFFKGYEQPAWSLLLLPPKSVTNCKWPQGKQEHSLCGGDSHCVCCAEKKNYMLEIQQKALISPQSDKEHHVNTTKNRSEIS